MILSERYSRQINLQGFGAEAQQKLQQAKVLVAGAGGLGIPVLQYLCAMGVGTIGIADGDVVSISNLNRQVMYTENDAGKPKVEIAIAKLSEQNPSINLLPFYQFLSVDNVLEIVKEFDVIIDATDNFSVRYLINDACVILNKPFVYGAIHQFEGHVSVFNFNGGPTYRCLYPDFPSVEEIPDCNTAGVLGVVPGIIGCYQGLEAVKVITGIGKNSSGYLQIFDFLQNDQYQVKLKLKPENKQLTRLAASYEQPNCRVVQPLKAAELFNWYNQQKRFILLDVREQEEYNQAHLKNAVSAPLSNLYEQNQAFDDNIPVVTFCQKGGRSTIAAKFLTEKHSDKEIYSVQGGMEQWLKEIGNKYIIHE